MSHCTPRHETTGSAGADVRSPKQPTERDPRQSAPVQTHRRSANTVHRGRRASTAWDEFHACTRGRPPLPTRVRLLQHSRLRSPERSVVKNSDSVRPVLGASTREHALRDVAWVAQFLGVSRSWVYQAVASGVLPCIRVGALVRFDPAVIKNWVNGGSSARTVKLPSCR